LNGSTDPAAIIAEEYQWRLFNGTFSVLIAFGFIAATLVLRTAREWTLFNPLIRQMLAEYSTFLMVMIWTGVSYIPQNTPEYIPRRLVIEATTSPNSMEAWSTITRLNELDDWHIGAAVVPAIVITVLFYFDHNVSAQLAQVCVFRNFFSL
jgi:boron transporter